MQSVTLNLKFLSHEDLHLQTKQLVENERRITTEVLHHLHEIDRRMIYAARGYPSLFAYAVSELKYDEASAYRRIAAMRLLVEFPMLKEKINSGKLNVSVLTQAATFFRKRKKAGKPVSSRERGEIIEELESKSKREALAFFAKRAPEITLAAETVIPLNSAYEELKIPISKKLHTQLNRIRELWAHQHDGSYEDVLGLMAEFVLKKIEPEIKSKSIPIRESEQPQKTEKLNFFGDAKNSKMKMGVPDAFQDLLSLEKVRSLQRVIPYQRRLRSRYRSRYIDAETRRAVFIRDAGSCTYTDPVTGKRCGSRYKTQYEHCQPFALGGENSIENLTLHCANHNRMKAAKVFGVPRPIRA